ncbi:MAG TPA: ATP-binding protein, partial [Thiohalobacter sp.]|nr:ATP-binding protein [Thiohalobacter sp.]
MESIQRHINLRLGLALLLVYVMFGLAASYSFRLLTEHYIGTRLEHDAQGLLVALGPAGSDQTLRLQPARVSPIYDRVFSGHYYQIESGGQVLRSRSLWDQALSLPPLEAGQTLLRHQAGPENQLLLVRVRRYMKEDRDLLLAVAEDLTPIRDNVRRLQLIYALLGLAVLLGLLAYQRRALRLGFAPVSRTCRELEQLQQGELARLDEGVPRELSPLVQQINRLLEVLQGRLTRSRNALGNLAHALKTPLARLQQELDHLPAGEEEPQLRERLQQQLDQIRALMERELRRARLAGRSESAARLALRPVFDGLIGVVRQVYADKGLHIECEIAESLTLQADAQDLMELFGNLLDNACKWARGRVRVHAARQAGRLWVRIEDDGPGVDAERRLNLSERGVRADEQGVAGHGLGLAIAADVVELYGGRMTFGQS